MSPMAESRSLRAPVPFKVQPAFADEFSSADGPARARVSGLPPDLLKGAVHLEFIDPIGGSTSSMGRRSIFGEVTWRF